ncbi:hypothetical protein, partial [Methanoregula sp.]|uniref:hypothetical protein n=1 Tax=Methanoregula sp. TaxID=2052170 RepID=UPI000CBD1BBC
VKNNLPIWNCNSIAEFFLEIILKQRDALEESFRSTREDRTAFAARLSGLPFVRRVCPSEANFLVIELSRDGIPRKPWSTIFL